MTELEIYFKLGLDHILDLQAYDHMAFLLALVALYSFHQWRKIVWLVTAFTIGHCITLILSGSGYLSLSPSFVEMTIAISIVMVALVNLSTLRFGPYTKRGMTIHYLIVLLFGLLHGLGFAGYIKALLRPDESLWSRLLSFNLGIETAQLLIVGLVLIANYFFLKLMPRNQKTWMIVLSSIALAIGLQLIISRI